MMSGPRGEPAGGRVPTHALTFIANPLTVIVFARVTSVGHVPFAGGIMVGVDRPSGRPLPPPASGIPVVPAEPDAPAAPPLPPEPDAPPRPAPPSAPVEPDAPAIPA